MTPPLRDRSDLIWASWLGASLGSFALIEVIAFFTDRPTTLCRSLRRWFGIDPRHQRHHIAAGVFFAFWLALWVHLETLPPLARK